MRVLRRRGQERLSDETKLGGLVNVVTGLVCFEPGGEFVGVVEDFLGGAGHGGLLRYLGRADMACTMIATAVRLAHTWIRTRVEEVTMQKSQRWDEYSTRSKVLMVLLAAVQVLLAVIAWTDLVQRPAQQVNGHKSRWAAIIAINFIGPMLYFTRGRVRVSASR